MTPRWHVSFAATVAILLAATPAAAETVVVCHGDSITRGAHLKPEETYPAMLQAALPDTKVVNTGIGGNTSQQGLKRLAPDVLSRRPKFVVLLFGTNDSVLTAPGRYRVPVDQYRQNLGRMIAGCRQAGADVVLCTLPAIEPEPYFTRHPKPYYDAEGGLTAILQRYRTAALEVGKSMKVPVVDLYETFDKDKSLLRPAPDGVHPNARGARAIGKLVAEQLATIGLAPITPVKGAPDAEAQRDAP